MNKIILKFDDTIERISGNSFGQRVYREQVKDTLSFPFSEESQYIIVFPNHVKYIGSSFVQGFIMEITEYVQKDMFYQYFKIEGNTNLIKQFREELLNEICIN